MIVDGLGSVTFVNGILRVQLTNINGEGKIVEAGCIEIPGAKVGDVIQGLASASKGIVDKLNESNEQEDSDNKPSKKSNSNSKSNKKNK
tara:strand:+ start:197 stop:463 length:267 start_codon:yes stop_codon:yes gene_type:complete